MLDGQHHHKFTIRKSIATYLLRIIFTWYLILAILVTLVQLGLEYTSVRKRVENDILSLGETFKPGIEDAVWMFDQRVIKSTVEGIIQNSIVTGISVKDHQGKILQAMGKIPSDIDIDSYYKGFQVKHFKLLHHIGNNRQIPLGSFSIISSNDVVIKQIKYSFLIILVNSIVKTTALWVIFLLVVHKLLIRPLVVLTQSVAKFDPENADQIDFSIETKGHNELKVLELTFKALIQKLLITTEELKTLNLNLEKKVETRTLLLTETNEQFKQEIRERKQVEMSLRKSEEQIKASLKEKETLLQEIHHRVKNNMMVISSLLSMQARRTDDDRIKEALKESQGRVYTMSAVHEKLYESENLSEIEIKPFLTKITRTISQSYQINPEQINFTITSDKIKLGIEQATPLGLVINELISNAFKYAFPDERKGEINVDMKQLDNKNLELTVADNGIGIPDNLDWRKTTSLGLQLVTTLVEGQLDGSVDIERKNGTKFIIKFNIDET